MTTQLAPPSQLRVEYESEPVNLDPTEPPRFGWRVETDRPGAAQRAFQIRLAESSEPLESSIWDSGRVESARATDVCYDGPPLEADSEYYWTVRIWTDAGTVSEWATPARFATALDSWDGEWIGHQPGAGDSQGWRSEWRAAEWNGEEWVCVDLGGEKRISSVSLHPAKPYGTIETPDGVTLADVFGADETLTGFGFPDAYRIEVATTPEFENGTVVADHTDGVERPVERPHSYELQCRARYVRVVATDLQVLESIPSSLFSAFGDRSSPSERWQCFALAALEVEAEGGCVSEGCAVEASSSADADGWGPAHLTDGVRGSQLAGPSPQLRTEFELSKPVASARLHAATPGYGELSVNGEQVSEGVLDPAWTRYGDRVLYSTHEVGDQLARGSNALGCWLGRGWFGKAGDHLWTAHGSPRALINLTIEFVDGTQTRVSSGSDWEARQSPVVENDIYDGERYDAREEQPGWSTPRFDGHWDSASRMAAPGGSLHPQRMPAMDTVETFEPVEITTDEQGALLDFGQNLTGWLELTIRAPERGQEVSLEHAEALTDDGELSTTDLRSADATDSYIARGEDVETYQPRFTYHGFRYARIEGYPGAIEPDDVTAKAIHTPMERRGDFACADDALEQVQHNAVWGLRGTTHSIPEDCPQRDERLGWTGDAQITARALLFNFDALQFHEKWMRDHDDATGRQGFVGDVIPNQVEEIPGDPTWSVTRVMIPWYLYLHDGNRTVLERHYEQMKAYVEYWHGLTEAGVLPGEVGRYGDWLAFEETDGRVGEPRELFCTAFHYQVTKTFARIAEVVGENRDSARYQERAATIRAGFNREFFDAEPAVYGPGTQSSYAVALFLGLVPESQEADVVENLVAKVEQDGTRLKTGFLGTRPLVLALAEHGHAELAYELISQPEQPGWVYMAEQGATTMWERWDSDSQIGSGMNSLNHSPFTFVSELFYEVLAGLRLREDTQPVTDHVQIEPAFVAGLDSARGSVETPNGELSSAWEQTASGYRLTVTVPWNVRATVVLPGAVRDSLTVGGEPADSLDAVELRVEPADAVHLEVGAGSYTLEWDSTGSIQHGQSNARHDPNV